MNPIRQILVPVDFSEPSRRALDHAAMIARAFGASIDLLHAWEAPSFVPPNGLVTAGSSELSLMELVRSNANEALDRFVTEVRKSGIPVRDARAEQGHAGHTIVELAKSGGYDLIVIGTHGRTGLSRVLLGSVAESVVRHAHCPVLSVRLGESP